MWPAEWWTGGGAIDELDGTHGEASRRSDDFKAQESQGQSAPAGLDATTRAVDDVSLTVAAGETLAVVGESGLRQDDTGADAATAYQTGQAKTRFTGARDMFRRA